MPQLADACSDSILVKKQTNTELVTDEVTQPSTGQAASRSNAFWLGGSCHKYFTGHWVDRDSELSVLVWLTVCQ